MPRILIAECMQEISSFNPVPSEYDYFRIQRGDEMLAQRGLNPAIGGALAVFEQRDDVAVVPTYARAFGQRRPAVGGRLAALVGGTAGRGALAHRRGGRHLRLAARRDGGERRARSRRRAAHGDPRDGGTRDADRGLARPARHPDRTDAAPDRRAGDLPHLSARRFRRYRRACGAIAAGYHRSPARPGDRAGHHPGAGARRRADHPHRLLRRSDPRGAAAGARGPRAGRRHHDRQPVHRRAGAVQPGADRGGAGRRVGRARSGAAGLRVLAAAPPHAGQADRARPRDRAGALDRRGRWCSPMRRTPPPPARPAIPTPSSGAARGRLSPSACWRRSSIRRRRRRPTRPGSAPRSPSGWAARSISAATADAGDRHGGVAVARARAARDDGIALRRRPHRGSDLR